MVIFNHGDNQKDAGYVRELAKEINVKSKASLRVGEDQVGLHRLIAQSLEFLHRPILASVDPDLCHSID